jgi:putative redox protein
MMTKQTDPTSRAGDLLLPAGPPRAFAIYAFRAQQPAGRQPASAIPAALAARGIAVLAIDLDSAQAATDSKSAQGHDVAILRRAADTLRAHHGPPSLLIGHSAAGPVILAAAASVPSVRAVVTVGSPAPGSRLRVGVPLLVLHVLRDPVVSAREASRVFAAVSHPKSFIALDGVDHAVSQPHPARHVAALITAWAEPYLPDPTPPTPLDPAGSVVVTDAGTGRYTQQITAGRHLLSADEPVSVGGADAGPTPYDLLLAALGACTAMTLRMYADRTGLPLHRTTVRLRHDRVHAKDCAQTEQNTGKLSRIRREIDIEGPLNDQERQRLVEIADRCPVHRTLSSEIVFETTEA